MPPFTNRLARRRTRFSTLGSLSSLALVVAAACGGEAPPVVQAPAAPPPSASPSAVPGVGDAQAARAYPKWAVGDTVDTYTGAKGAVRVADPYRSLEPWNDAVREWSAAQTVIARTEIDRYPGIASLRTRVTELKRGGGPTFSDWTLRKGVLFAKNNVPPKQQATLVVVASTSDAGSARVIVDPNVIDPSGKTTIDFYVPSLDGKRVAVSLSKAGTESGDVHIYEVAAGKELPDVLARVNGGRKRRVERRGDGPLLHPLSPRRGAPGG